MNANPRWPQSDNVRFLWESNSGPLRNSTASITFESLSHISGGPGLSRRLAGSIKQKVLPGPQLFAFQFLSFAIRHPWLTAAYRHHFALIILNECHLRVS